jgi:hypothetical protein
MSTFITRRKLGTKATGKTTTTRVSVLLAAALVASVLFAQAISATDAYAASVQRSDYVTAGDFRTVATLWNTSAIGDFSCPAGAKIRVRYAAWWGAVNRQEQDLDCQSVKRLSVGGWSVFVARMQIKVPTSTTVTWTYTTPGGP